MSKWIKADKQSGSFQVSFPTMIVKYELEEGRYSLSYDWPEGEIIGIVTDGLAKASGAILSDSREAVWMNQDENGLPLTVETKEYEEK